MSTNLALGAILAATAWLGMAFALPSLPRHWRVRGFWFAVATAVPLLGWLTYAWGPGLGVAAFLAGLLALQRRMRRPRRDRRERLPCGSSAALPPAE